MSTKGTGKGVTARTHLRPNAAGTRPWGLFRASRTPIPFWHGLCEQHGR